MTSNRVVVYKGPGETAVEPVDYPKLDEVRHRSPRDGRLRGDPQARTSLRLSAPGGCGRSRWLVC